MDSLQPDSPRRHDAPHPTLATSAVRLVRDFWVTGTTLLTAFAAFLSTLFALEGPYAVFGYSVFVLFTISTVWAFFHDWRRRSARRRRIRFVSPDSPYVAFRGLCPFDSGDMLPGEHRRREAHGLLTQLRANPSRFNVISGDSGCGKTSLLRSTFRSLLAEHGWDVVMIPNRGDLGLRSQDDENGATIDSCLSALNRRLQDTSTDAATNRVLIIDQFEELLLHFPDMHSRSLLGTFFGQLLATDKHLTILCAIRNQELCHLLQLAPGIREPLATAGVFRIYNFTQAQATDVLQECAHLDDITCDDALAHIIVADLTHGDEVRPVELQIVCTALVGDLQITNYRRLGGARGILAAYIRDAIETSPAPRIARYILTVLCDLTTHTKSDPRSFEEMCTGLEDLSGFDGPSDKTTRRVLEHLVGAQLVLSHGASTDAEKFQLTHDYIVDPIRSVTDEEITKAVRNRIMQEHYASEARTGRRTTVPFFQLWHFHRYARRYAPNDPIIRRLFRRSICYVFICVGIAVLLPSLIGGVIV